MLWTPPRLSRWNWSAVGIAWGTTPQKLLGSASAAAAVAPKSAIASATVAVKARALPVMHIRSLVTS